MIKEYESDSPSTEENNDIFVPASKELVRWKIFRFHAQIAQEKQRQISPCGKCFATLVLGVQDSHEDGSTTGNHE